MAQSKVVSDKHTLAVIELKNDKYHKFINCVCHFLSRKPVMFVLCIGLFGPASRMVLL